MVTGSEMPRLAELLAAASTKRPMSSRSSIENLMLKLVSDALRPLRPGRTRETKAARLSLTKEGLYVTFPQPRIVRRVHPSPGRPVDDGWRWRYSLPRRFQPVERRASQSPLGHQ